MCLHSTPEDAGFVRIDTDHDVNPKHLKDVRFKDYEADRNKEQTNKKSLSAGRPRPSRLLDQSGGSATTSLSETKVRYC